MKAKFWARVLLVVVVLSFSLPVFAEGPVAEDELTVGFEEVMAGKKALAVRLAISPNPVIYGHRPVTAWAIVANPTRQAQKFESEVWLGGDGWGRETYPYSFSPGTSVTNFYAQDDWQKYYWSGVVPAKGIVYLKIPTFSWVWTGEFTFLKINLTSGLGSPLALEKKIKVVEGKKPAEAKFSFTSPPYAGSLVGLRLVIESPKTTQFYADEPALSTCGIDQLPAGFYGHPQRTYEEFLWHVQMPEKPGLCEIKVRIKFWNSDKVINVVYKFKVLPKS